MKMFPTKKSQVIGNLINYSAKELSKYSKKRNYDLGPPHKNVSKLSPYLRTRFITEEEVLKIAVSNNNIKTIEKFIEEIFWRTYWRGWLELHPQVYFEFQNNIKTYEILNKTGIKCFDDWTDELIETGYLHNHARMWYASIWIFTLKRRWEEGAHFFSDHLLDFCPASNTLGWRWVAGLQTTGKHYLANAENIKKFTNNRYYPVHQLNEKELPIEDKKNLNSIVKSKIPYKEILIDKIYKKKLGLILTNNDLSLNEEINKYKITNYEKCIFFEKSQKSNIIKSFEYNIFKDVQKRNVNCELIRDFQSLINWVSKKKIENLIIPYETVGSQIVSKKEFLNYLRSNGVKYFFYLRDWDKYSFPHANKGFFPFKKKIPDLLIKNGLNNIF